MVLQDANTPTLCVCLKPGPPGALLRWLLADLNFAAPGAAAWFPFGTFAANLLACAVIFAMEVRALPHYMSGATVRIVHALKQTSTGDKRRKCMFEGPHQVK